MGLVQRLMGRSAKPDAPDSVVGMVRMGGSAWSARWSFTRTLDSVYSNPTARRCVERMASDFQRPDWQLLKPGTEESAPEDHASYGVLREPRKGLMSGTTMQYHISRDLDLTGGTFWLKLRGGDDGIGDGGPVSGLRRLPSHRMTVIADDDDDLIGFVYQDRIGRIALLSPDDVVYVKYPHPERPADRMAPALVAGLSSETDTIAMKFNFELLSNDSALPGYLLVEGLTTKQFDEWVAQWESGDAPGKTRFMNGANAKYIKVGQTNQELTYQQLRDASREDICRAFGPPRVLIDPTDATFANMDIATASYIKSLIDPRWTMVGDEFTMQLGVELGGWEIGFDLSEIEELQEGQDAYVKRAVLLLDRKVLTINEVREDMGRDPVPWGDDPAVLNPVPAANTSDNALAAGGSDSAGAGDTVTNMIAVTEMRALPSAVLTKDGIAIDGFDARVQRHENSATRSMNRFFDRQGKAVVKRIRAKKGRTKAVDDWWDGERWDEELASAWSPLLGDTVDSIGTLSLGTFSPGSEFDATTSNVSDYLTNRSVTIAALVNDTTASDVRSILDEMQAEGASISEMAGAIEGYFTDQGSMRAERVARTEIIGAANWAATEGARQSGLVQAKTWLAASDAEPDCAALSGTTVALDDGFGGVDQPPLHPNCRCTLTFELIEQ